MSAPVKAPVQREEKALLDTLRPTRKHAGGAVPKIDLDKALEMRLKGLSYQDIADHFDCSRQAVQERLKPYLPQQEVDTETYKKRRADLFASRQAAVLSCLTEDRLKKASVKDLTMAFGVLYDKERLERGQSTSNQSVFFHIVQESDEAE